MKYYEVTVLIAVDTERLGWDSGCDETFGVQQLLSSGLGSAPPIVSSYKRVDKAHFDKNKNNIFTEEGGI